MTKDINRRQFTLGSASLVGAGALGGANASASESAAQNQDGPFSLRYAPPLGMFNGHASDPVEQVHWIADQGFTAIEDNGMPGRPKEVQEAIRKALDQHDMQMGVFVAHSEWGGPSFNAKDFGSSDRFKNDMQNAIETAKRVGAKWMTVVPGKHDQRVHPEFQLAYCVDNLRRAAEMLEPHGLVMVLEPLNWLVNHPGMYLERTPQAYAICRGVNSPSCKILYDIYHQQISEGDLIHNIDRAWDEIAYFQIGDNPGRKEPGTGEINYRKIFEHLKKRGFEGLLGMEHGKAGRGTEGELAVVRAYREHDPR